MVKRVIISQDYDGCYSIAAPGGIEAEKNGANGVYYKSYPELAKVLDIIPQMYQDYLSSITKDATAVSVYVGSDRQSNLLDSLNARNNQNGSVFPALKALCAQRTTEECPWNFEPYLLADGKHPRGTALQKIEANEPKHKQLPAPKPTQFTEGGHPSKIPMLIKQMHDAAQQYPNQELEFHFIDDRGDLIKDITDNLSPQDIPAGMTFKISKFDYVGVVQGEDNSLGHVQTISSAHQLIQPAEPPVKEKVEPQPPQTSSQEILKKTATAPENIETKALKTTIKEYLAHLKKKINEEGTRLDYKNEQKIEFAIPEHASTLLEKLIIRHNAMATLNSQIQNKETLEPVDIEPAKHAARTCIDNKPTWSERPFLQKLTDFLSLGLKPLYRAFFSKEETFQEELELRTNQHPSMGG